MRQVLLRDAEELRGQTRGQTPVRLWRAAPGAGAWDSAPLPAASTPCGPGRATTQRRTPCAGLSAQTPRGDGVMLSCERLSPQQTRVRDSHGRKTWNCRRTQQLLLPRALASGNPRVAVSRPPEAPWPGAGLLSRGVLH